MFESNIPRKEKFLGAVHTFEDVHFPPVILTAPNPEKDVVFKAISQFLTHAAQDRKIEEILAHSSKTLAKKGVLDITVDCSRLVGFGSSLKFPYHGIFYDAPYAFVLTLNKDPLALIGFEPGSIHIDVIQIQGVKGKEKSTNLSKLGRWEQRLLQVVEEYAYFYGKPQVWVQGGRSNTWLSNDNRLPEKRALERYDQVALALGYHYSEKLKRYVKYLPTNPNPCPLPFGPFPELVSAGRPDIETFLSSSHVENFELINTYRPPKEIIHNYNKLNIFKILLINSD